MRFSETLKRFSQQAVLGDLYFMRTINDFYLISKELDKVAKLDNVENMINSVKAKSIRRDMYYFCLCPMKLKNDHK